MTKEGQELTRAAYADPEIVAGYVERNAQNPRLAETAEAFAQSLPGNRVVDIGCGPGHDTYHFAELGLAATGVDYSPEMIRTAEGLQPSDNPPHFQVADMREIGDLFPADSFDGAWVSASLLHIPQEDAPRVLNGIRSIVVNGGKVYIGLKGGKQGAEIVTDTKYNKPVQREFTFWERENFQHLAEEQGFKVEDFEQTQDGVTGNNPTTWLNFLLEVQK